MQVQEIMTNNPACCTPTMDLQQVAQKMAQFNCGALPVVEDERNKRIIGIITDRDITCRAVAKGQNPSSLTAADCMTSPVYTVSPDTDLTDCIHVMEEHQIRRVPVSDKSGCCCGMVAQADIVLYTQEQEAGELLREISQPDLTLNTTQKPYLH